jgi:hypothetical protein
VDSVLSMTFMTYLFCAQNNRSRRYRPDVARQLFGIVCIAVERLANAIRALSEAAARVIPFALFRCSCLHGRCENDGTRTGVRLSRP